MLRFHFNSQYTVTQWCHIYKRYTLKENTTITGRNCIESALIFGELTLYKAQKYTLVWWKGTQPQQQQHIRLRYLQQEGGIVFSIVFAFEQDWCVKKQTGGASIMSASWKHVMNVASAGWSTLVISLRDASLVSLHGDSSILQIDSESRCIENVPEVQGFKHFNYK